MLINDRNKTKCNRIIKIEEDFRYIWPVNFVGNLPLELSKAAVGNLARVIHQTRQNSQAALKNGDKNEEFSQKSLPNCKNGIGWG